MRPPVYLRGHVYWCKVSQPSGRARRTTTRTSDYRIACDVWRELERRSLHAPHRAEDAPALRVALGRRLDERRAAGRSEGTLRMLVAKGRHLTRVLDGLRPISAIDAAEVDRYVAVRLKEEAARHTIQKELSTLRGALRLAKRRGEYHADLDAVMPEFAVKYRPRTRALSEAEAEALLVALRPRLRRIVAFILATGATFPSEVLPFSLADYDEARQLVHLRGTKRAARDRWVPIVTDAGRRWLDVALERARAKGPVFARWQSVGRDLKAACARAGIPDATPNDLRRTVGTLLRAAGVEPQVIGMVLGHADSRMVERVYGRLDPERLRDLLAQRVSGGTGRVQRQEAS